jgi:hypothetical protein
MTVAARIDRQLDHELHWIVTETVSGLFREASTVRRVDLCKTVGLAVGRVLLERMQKDARDLKLVEFERLGHEMAGKKDETVEGGPHVTAARVAEACVAFAEIRAMGMDSPYVRRPSLYDDSYNPFGNEGGFCNPVKLKNLG